jgi:hypothetical protein
VSFLSGADILCMRNIEMTPLCKVQMALLPFVGSRRMCGGDVDERTGIRPA